MFFTTTSIGFVILGIIAAFYFGPYWKPNYIQNFEEDEYGRENSFVEPTLIVNGLAVYSVGNGKAVLLFPYPHSHTVEPMAQSKIARILTGMGRRVITFDVPGAFQSTREPVVGDMEEMIRCADQALEHLRVQGSVDVVGHSMGGLAALAFAIERPEHVQRLVLITSLSGFPAAARWGFPGSAFGMHEADYWRVIVWGICLNAGKGNLALHKKLFNLMARASHHDETFFRRAEIDPGDYEKGVPIRTIWSRNMYSRLSYADRLNEVQAETLILAGRHDPQAPIECSEELFYGIPNASLIIFEESGHFPFIEEALYFARTVDNFLNEELEH